MKRWTMQTISNGTYSVDTFFTLSGFLLAYVSLCSCYTEYCLQTLQYCLQTLQYSVHTPCSAAYTHLQHCVHTSTVLCEHTYSTA